MARKGAARTQQNKRDQDRQGVDESAAEKFSRHGPLTRKSIHPVECAIFNPGADAKNTHPTSRHPEVRDVTELDFDSRSPGVEQLFAKEIALLRAHLGQMIDTILFTEDTS